MRIPVRKYCVASALGFGAVGAFVMALSLSSAPAQAIIVFDPSNYSQNILTAARTLQQINNQIQSLQNDAQMLVNQARNLTRIDFPQLQAITQTLQQIDQLMGQAQAIRFQVTGLDQQFARQFPDDFGAALGTNQRVIAARSRLDATMDGFRHTMTVQAQVVENVQADAQALSAIVARSQGADGALQVSQATNQLLALTAKQQFQIQTLMAAQYRATTAEAARRLQAEQEARNATKKFLGSGTAYTPK
ncbi:MAG: P-type conjugative transfer protein TrbJ [Sphingobium sp. 66-54]|nr:MAG: P-type conjugative transfer protein TrbJ [Sphingobium sp. 66-54]